MIAAELVKAVEQLSPRDFADFVAQVSVLRARRHAPCLPAEEAKLLKQINRGFSHSWWQHYRKLIEKRQDETLTGKQQAELVRLTDMIEKREGERLKALVELARLRRQSLTSLMRELELPGTSNG